MSKKKLIAVAIILALILLIGGMLAYFTDTDTATNVFTLGDDVQISITEADWTNSEGTTTWTSSSAQGVHPGVSINKSPKIHNDSTTTPAYVFAEIVVPCYDNNADGTVETQLYTFTANTGWVRIDSNTVDTAAKTITYVYAYEDNGSMKSLAANTETSTAVFSSVTVAPTLTSAQKATTLPNPNIIVNAYGIQTDGLSSNTPSDIFALCKN